MATLLVTASGLGSSERHRARRAIRRALPGCQILGTGFLSVYLVDGPGEAHELAQKLVDEAREDLGHVTAVVCEVESKLEPIREAAVKIGLEQIRAGESFCFRLHKRRPHGLELGTPEIERDCGGAVWDALEQARGITPVSDLNDPAVTVVAEVLGPRAMVGFARRGWRPARLARPQASFEI